MTKYTTSATEHLSEELHYLFDVQLYLHHLTAVLAENWSLCFVYKLINTNITDYMSCSPVTEPIYVFDDNRLLDSRLGFNECILR